MSDGANGKLRGYFGGTVLSMTPDTAEVEIDKGLGVEKGETVTVLRKDFQKQMPMPSNGSYVEGVVFYRADDLKKDREFKYIVRPV